MKRKIKNIIMIALLVLLISLNIFTIYLAKEGSSVKINQNNNVNMVKPDESNSNLDANDNSTSSNTPPSMNGDNTNSGDSSNTPPAKPEEDNKDTQNNSSSNNQNNTSSDNQNSNTKENQNGQGSNSQGSDVPSMPSGNMTCMTEENSIDTIYYISFITLSLGISLLVMYLVMSRFNKKSLKETLKGDKLIIYVLSVIILTSVLSVSSLAVANKLSNSNTQNASNNMNNVNESKSANANAKKEVSTSETLDGTYKSSSSDESALIVKNGATLTLKGATVNKSSGDSTNLENSEFYGVNAGILVQKSSTAKISNTTITTNAKGSNAVFATGEDAKIYINDSKITTSGSASSRGLDATYGGYIKADSIEVKTEGASSASLATDRGEGTVIASNSSLETNGQGSPLIYSTGDISVTNVTGKANNSQAVVIEGKNSASVTNSTLVASASPNRKEVDQAGVMIYQSMSGDASEGLGVFTAKDSSIKIATDSSYYKTAPMFFVTNTKAKINLTNTKLSYGSSTLLSVKGTSEWGNSNSNGGDVTLNASKQTLKGNIEVDNISTVTINLKNKSSYEGMINNDNSAKKVNLVIDKTSTIKLTGDTYVTKLTDKDTSYSNIDFNGYKLYVNGKSIN